MIVAPKYLVDEISLIELDIINGVVVHDGMFTGDFHEHTFIRIKTHRSGAPL